MCRARVTLALRRFFPSRSLSVARTTPPPQTPRRPFTPYPDDVVLTLTPFFLAWVKGTFFSFSIRTRRRRHIIIIIISRHVLYSCVHYIYIAAIIYILFYKQVAHYNCSDSSGGGGNGSSSGSLLTVGSYGPAFSHTPRRHTYIYIIRTRYPSGTRTHHR